MPFELPVLSLGLAGFTPEQGKQLASLLAQLPKGFAGWQGSAFPEADAWLVSGEKSRLLHADTLKILAGRPTERAIQLTLSEIDRPIAFSLPLAPGNLDPMYTFDPGSAASLYKVLQQFQTRLRGLCCQFMLGGQLIARETQLQPGIYHVSHRGNLLAVMDFIEWKIGISPNASPVDLELATWDRRPLAARGIPEHFESSSLSQLRWVYAQRTRGDVLPSRYRSRPVYFRRAPDVPLRWLRDSQLVLLRALSREVSSFDGLQQRTGLTSVQLARDLASLYFAGSITTTPEKAGTGSFGTPDAYPGQNSGGAALQVQPSLSGARGLSVPVAADLTVPGRLGPQ
jgi:hypothetical protein